MARALTVQYNTTNAHRQESDRAVNNNEVLALVQDQLPQKELGLLSMALRSDVEISSSIPDDASPEEVWDHLKVCAAVYARIRRAHIQIKPILGRVINVIEKRPDIYQKYGFRNFDEFMSKGVGEMFGLPRSEAYQAKRIAAAFPQLTLAEYGEYGSTKLIMISRVTRYGEPSCDEWLQRAKDNTVVELDNMLVRTGIPAAHEERWTTFKKRVKMPTADRLEEFLADPEIQAYCEAKNADGIFNRMVEECYIEWKARIRERLQRAA